MIINSDKFQNTGDAGYVAYKIENMIFGAGGYNGIKIINAGIFMNPILKGKLVLINNPVKKTVIQNKNAIIPNDCKIKSDIRLP